MQTVFQVHTEDHITPLLKLVQSARLLLPHPLPDLPPPPETMVRVETRFVNANLTALIFPSSELVSWLAKIFEISER